MSAKVSREVKETGHIGCIPYSYLGRIRVVTYIAKFNNINKDKKKKNNQLFSAITIAILKVIAQKYK